jgi:diguanylate cyclase (GGDEF)-like protein
MRVLIVHNSDSCRTTLQTLLQAWGYEPVVAVDAGDAERILDGDDAPRLVILDAALPHSGGYVLCERIRERQKAYIYVILLSTDLRQSTLYRGYESGADEVIREAFRNGELKLRLNVAERILQSHQVLVAARDAMQFEASQDALVKLWNRKAILNLLSIELSRAKRTQAPLSIFFADLDHFKLINDRHGHLVGDEVLRSAAARMSSALREYDHLGRYGGEEFLAVLPNCNVEAARDVAERVRRSLAEHTIATKSTTLEVTVSIGVAEWRSGQELPALLEKADAALYHAKHDGRNRVEVEDGGEEPQSAPRPQGTPKTAAEPETEAASRQPFPPAAKQARPNRVRNHRRMVIDRPLEIVTLSEGTSELLQARMRDVSETGLGAVVPRSLDLNQSVTLHFQMEDDKKCTVAAVVRYCNWPYVGFEFTFLEPRVRDSIKKIAREYLGDENRRGGPSMPN